ncbi:MAG: hypothetical protein JSR54_00610 [Proteobacteria bacterium]|nr:hypothetical protein [Pseudomonadota bacterium]
MWKRIRVGILLAVLLVVAGSAWLENRRIASWRDPVYVGIFPLAADESRTTRAYLDGLTAEAFRGLEPFFAREAHRWGMALSTPFRVELFPSPAALPPPAPLPGNPLATVWWSLRLRWYAWRASDVAGRLRPHVRLFILYHDPTQETHLDHSLGLSKGRVGVVNAFAARAADDQNAIVIAHELLHTVGATDKYDPATDAPLYPQGYADPGQRPLLPQRRAEIMAGRRAIAPGTQEMPDSLDECLIGEATAREIGWLPR